MANKAFSQLLASLVFVFYTSTGSSLVAQTERDYFLYDATAFTLFIEDINCSDGTAKFVANFRSPEFSESVETAQHIAKSGWNAALKSRYAVNCYDALQDAFTIESRFQGQIIATWRTHVRDPEWESGLKVINFSRVGDASRADITPYLYSELIERLEGGEFGSWRDGDARRERMHSELVLLSDIHPILREIPDYRFLEVLYSDPDLFSGWGVDNPKRETLEALEEISIEGHVSATERLAYLSGLRGLLKEIKSQSNIANSFTITPEQQERYNDLIQIHSRAIEHRVALIVQLTNHIIETGGSFSLSGIARNDNATPFSNSIENALNAVLRDRAGLADSVLRPIYGVPSGFLYQCDIDWCYALGGMGQFRIVSQSKPDCVLLSEGRSRCEFRYHMNFKQLISITQNHPLTDLVNSASRLADETEATAEFVYEDGVWHLAGAIE